MQANYFFGTTPRTCGALDWKADTTSVAQDCFVGLLDCVEPEMARTFEVDADGGFDRVEYGFEEVRGGRGWEACVLGMFCESLLGGERMGC